MIRKHTELSAREEAEAETCWSEARRASGNQAGRARRGGERQYAKVKEKAKI